MIFTEFFYHILFFFLVFSNCSIATKDNISQRGELLISKFSRQPIIRFWKNFTRQTGKLAFSEKKKIHRETFFSLFFEICWKIRTNLRNWLSSFLQSGKKEEGTTSVVHASMAATAKVASHRPSADEQPSFSVPLSSEALRVPRNGLVVGRLLRVGYVVLFFKL